MKSKIPTNLRATLKGALAGAAIGWMCWTAGNAGHAQTPPPNLSPDLQEVIKLSQQKMGDEVITSYIKNSGKSYKLGADDIIYLNSQGVSQSVLNALLQASSAGGAPVAQTPPPTAPPTTTNPPSSPAAASPVPPPLDSPAPAAPAAPPSLPPPAPAPALAPAGLQDNFFSDPGLNPALWTTQSGVLTALAAMHGSQVLPALAFSPSGMQMSGVGGPGQFMGIQSTAAFVAPFNFSVTVSGLAQSAVPFEIYLVSADLQQWVSVAGHLGGRGGPRSGVEVGGGFGRLFRGDVRIPLGGSSPEYGVWVNHTGGGQPLAALGYKIFENPLAGLPYTIQVSLGADGAASVVLLDAGRGALAAQTVPVGTGPFYVVLAGRDGPTYAAWQSVQLLSPAPVAAAPAVVEAPVAPPVPTLDYFQAQLTPYGSWVNVPEYGLCWQPAVDAGWRPYYDGGYWTYTDAGWYWQSEYPWGDIAFHYGRWTYTAAGWLWVPGFDYAPAWVVWRHADADGYLGWAPLPAGAVFVDGGWMYRGAHVGVDFDFGISAGFFTFVACDHFWEHDFRHFIVPHDRMDFIYRRSVFENHFRMDHGRFINEGLGRDRMVVLTHRDIKIVGLEEVRRGEERHNLEVRRDDIHSFKPGQRPDARGVGVRPGERPGERPAQRLGDRPGERPDAKAVEGADHKAVNTAPERVNAGEGMKPAPGTPAGSVPGAAPGASKGSAPAGAKGGSTGGGSSSSKDKKNNGN